MTDQWKFQIRIYMESELADLARRDPDDPVLSPLADVLRRHHATLKCQYDAFAGYVAEAEQHGTENYPLYRWTKATIEDPAKKATKSMGRRRRRLWRRTWRRWWAAR
jgi:hypothetical protein